MTCFYPIKALKTWSHAEHKWKVKIIGPEEFYELENRKNPIKFEEIFNLPCGKCIGCRLDYAREWANRCMLEAKQYEFNEMLTLTYDEENLPITTTEEVAEGVKIYATLVKKDVQDFLKRLRQHWLREYNWQGIRFYMCGEYGEKFGRPHYHILLFNFPVYDKEFLTTNKKGFDQMTSKTIEKLWGKGRISLCPVTWETCSYVARYIMKKQTGNEIAKSMEERGQIQEYVCMSRNPGIAKDYFDKHKNEIYLTDEIFLSTNKGIQKVKPSRYFDKLYDLEDHKRLEEIKKVRVKESEEAMKNELKQTDLKKSFYLRVKETNKKAQTKKLIRDLE